jgi:hypothetical protein
MPYVVAKEDPNGFDILDTATGQRTYVARAGLSPQMQAQFSSEVASPSPTPTLDSDFVGSALPTGQAPSPSPMQTTDLMAPAPMPTPGGASGSWAPDQGMPAATTTQPKRDWMAFTPPNPNVPNVAYEGQPDLEGARKELGTMSDNMKTIYGEAAKSESEFQKKKADIIGAEQKQLVTHQANVAENEKRRQENLDRLYGDAQKDVGEIAQGIDTQRYWKTPNAPNKIVAVLSMALGAVGAAFTRSRDNVAINMIQDQINKDIDAQKEELANKRAQAGAKMNMLGQLRDKYGDERVAENVLRQGFIDQTMMTLDKLTAQSASESATTKGAQAFEQLRQEKLKLQLQFDNLAIEQQKVNLAKGAKGSAEGYVQGLGQAVSDQEAGNVRKMKDTYEIVTRGIQDLIDMRKEKGTEMFGTETRKESATKAASLQLELKNFFQLGQISAGDQKYLEKLIPEQPLGYGYTAAQLNEAKKFIQSRANIYFKNRIQNYQGIKNTEDYAAK